MPDWGSAQNKHAYTYLIRETLLEERCGDGSHGRHAVMGNNCLSRGEDVCVLLGAKVARDGGKMIRWRLSKV